MGRKTTKGKKVLDLNPIRKYKRATTIFYKKRVERLCERSNVHSKVAKEIANLPDDAPSDLKFRLVMYASLQDIYEELARINALIARVDRNTINLDEVRMIDEFVYDDLLKDSKLFQQLPEMREEVIKVREELESRRSGLNWIDNLIKHTPKTESEET